MMCVKVREMGLEMVWVLNVDGGVVKFYLLDKSTRAAVRAANGVFVDEGLGEDG